MEKISEARTNRPSAYKTASGYVICAYYIEEVKGRFYRFSRTEKSLIICPCPWVTIYLTHLTTQNL